MNNRNVAAGFFFVLLFACSCRTQNDAAPTLFYRVPAAHSGIDFKNTLHETEDFNIIEYLYFYNGGGVAIGDIDNDGLPDIFFSSNQGSNKLYHNKGNFRFNDITREAGARGAGNWKTGVTMADVNGDGFLDIFVCGVGSYKKFDGKNQLLINNGNLTFTDRTEEYGLSFNGFSTQAVFFDYDNDGDLDMYLLNHSVHSIATYGEALSRYQRDLLAGDRLFRNDLVPSGKNHFTDVTGQSGLFSSKIGYGLGIGVSDLDRDGYADLYVSNDFRENDYLYLNSGNGKFRDVTTRSLPHTSRFSMGNDIADVNNDGWPDIVSLDMLPKDEAVIKTSAGEDPYDIYEYKLRFGYHHQLARNSLQIHRGLGNDTLPHFSDVAPLAGTEATDWSWSPLLADFDNDGLKDLFVANGILHRPNDLDYIHFIASDSVQRYAKYDAFIRQMPDGKVPNVFFRNRGDLRMQDVTGQWIGQEPSLSTGAAYGDLDNDGDLDLVVNNINQVASIFRNDLPKDSAAFLQVKLAGESPNTSGIGAKVIVWCRDQRFYQEQMLTRGWQSSVSPLIHVGLGNADRVDSVTVIWPDHRYQTVRSVARNTKLEVRQTEAVLRWKFGALPSTPALLAQKTPMPFIHRENVFSAFTTEKLIPHMLSERGPTIAVGDISGDGFEDVFIGGGAGQPAALFVQDRKGNFREMTPSGFKDDAAFEDTGSAFFDADGNGTTDLLVVSGGQEFSGNHPLLAPRLYLNNGKGVLSRANNRLPEIFVDASCVRTADADGDGDADVFIGGRVVAGRYGATPESYLLLNDGKGFFKNAVHALPGAPGAWGQLGMVSDAAWSDLNNDGRQDLVIAGEWMPLTVLLQDAGGRFVDHSKEWGLANTHGWWNTLFPIDIDQDGDLDFAAGNLGWNSRLKAAPDQPVSLYRSDLDNNGSTDHILSYYNQGIQHPFVSRDQLVMQVPSFRKKFLKYASFRDVKLEDIIGEADTAGALHAYSFSSVLLRNNGQGRFEIEWLPAEAQAFPIFAFGAGDFNEDGRTDLLAAGNLFAVQPSLGRYDAGYGLMLLGRAHGRLEPVSMQASGFMVQGECRAIQVVGTGRAGRRIVVGRNNAPVLVFSNEFPGKARTADTAGKGF